MSNILEINSDSSDSENDVDYVPSEDDLSELSADENGSEEEGSATEAELVTKKKTNRRKKSRRNSSTKQKNEVNPEPNLNDEEEKQHAQNLWEDFLQDVKPCSQKGKRSSSSGDKSGTNICNQPDVVKREEIPKKVTISKVYDFAGESVVVSKEVDECSEEARNQNKITCASEKTQKINNEKGMKDREHANETTRKPVVATKRGSGLSSVIGNLTNKKQKLSTLQKSLIDWKSFTKEEGLQEDLEHNKKSKSSYLENQAFLQRSDLRVFEIEKSVRLGNKTNR